MLPSPMAEANRLSQLLSLAFQGEHRFPVDVKSVALEVSAQRFPNEPIRSVEDLNIGSFEGLLARHPEGRYWKIGYSSAGRSPERIRFTLAHELGHYLVHRQLRQRFECTDLDMHDWDAQGRQIEVEADVFASYLLMPLDDFRAQIADQPISIELLQHCAERYGVSLMAAALKWIEVAQRRAVVVAARDGFVLWARSNKAALRSGAYLRTRVSPPREVPDRSMLSECDQLGVLAPTNIPARVWFPKEPEDMEMTERVFVAAGHYPYTLGLLLLPDAAPKWEQADENEDNELDGHLQFKR